MPQNPFFQGGTTGGNPNILGEIQGGGVTDHGLLTGLSDDDHTQYALLAGRSGGQTLKGGIAASENLVLNSTAHATKGKLLFGNSAYDEVNNTLTLGNTVSPFGFLFHVLATQAGEGFCAVNQSLAGDLSAFGCGEDLFAGGDGERFINLTYLNSGQTDADAIHLSALGLVRTGPFPLLTNPGMALAVESNTGSIRFLTTGASGNCYAFTSERFRVGPDGQWGIGGSATSTYNTANFGLVGKTITSGGIAAPPTWSYPDSQYFTGTNWLDLTDGGATTLHSHAGGAASMGRTFAFMGA